MAKTGKQCRQCQTSFPINDRDRAFYKKMDVPEPTMCPECRLQRRLAHRMEWTLYMRKCDKSGKDILSVFPPESPYTVYDHEIWHGSGWNALDYGKDFDFSRPFFEQFSELLKAVPQPASQVSYTTLQNCEYVNQCDRAKNCYFTVEADHNEDSLYCYQIYHSKNCIDCYNIYTCQRCYECTDCENCFNLLFSQLCEQCSDSAFLFDCRSSSYCFACVGLRQKKYCMFNEQLTKEEYETRIKDFNFSNRQHLATAQKRFDSLKTNHPRKAFIGEQNDNVFGNYIYESKDCHNCYNIRKCRDCSYCELIRESKDCMDHFVWGMNAERIYECMTCGQNIQNLRFCCNTFEGSFDMTYCYWCIRTCAHCFGCVGLQKKEYCIFNKQYTKEEYEKLVPKIIDHMKKTGEWGEFFPIEISPHSYNETTAQEFFPLAKDEVANRGWKWKDDLPFTTGKETIEWDQPSSAQGELRPAGKIPENIDDVTESICDEVLACEKTGKNFRITKQELALYKQMHLPLPKLHYYERHMKRKALRNPRKLFKRECGNCTKTIETTYDPERPETVYCEKCYLETVY